MIDSPDFAKALAFALRWEIGNTPDGYISPEKAAALGDPGGETKYGISKRSYPHLDIAQLTLDDAKRIYFSDYWASDGDQESYCDHLPFPLNAVHFDCVVNVGNRTTAKDGTVIDHRRANSILQQALGVQDDGYIGPVTRAALAACEPVATARRAIRHRDLYYATRGAWADTFRAGWYNRTNSLRRTLNLQAGAVA